MCRLASAIVALIWIVLAWSLAPALTADEIYKHVDKNGNVSFSDRPLDGGKPIDLSPTNSAGSIALPKQNRRLSDSSPTGEYQSLRITRPQNDVTIHDNAGNLGVAVQVAPALRSGDSIRLLVDGSSPLEDSTSGGFQLLNVDRGTHQLQAQLLDNLGNVLLVSELVTVHLRRQSVQNRAATK